MIYLVSSSGSGIIWSLDSCQSGNYITIATKSIISNNTPFSQAYNTHMQLSVSLWKFNATLIKSRLPLDSDECFWDLAVMSVSALL